MGWAIKLTAFILLITGTIGLLMNEFAANWDRTLTLSFAVFNCIGLITLGITYFGIKGVGQIYGVRGVWGLLRESGKYVDMNVWRVVRSGIIGLAMRIGLNAAKKMTPLLKLVNEDHRKHMAGHTYSHLFFEGIDPLSNLFHVFESCIP